MRKIFFVIIFIFIFGLPTDLHAQDNPKAFDQQFEGFNLKGYTDSGEDAWEVRGDTADVKGSQVIISNVDADSYGEEKVNVTASSGTIDQASGNMELKDDVVITSERGTQLLTDTLLWDKQGDMVSTEDDVLITDERVTVSGRGMKSKPGLKSAEIKKDVTVQVDTDDDELKQNMLTITSDGPMVVDQIKGVATFEDNVFARQENRTLKADKMEVYFHEKMEQITEVICIGNVEIMQGDNKTFADRAVYNAVSQKISLFGRPKLILITEGEGSVAAIRD